MKPKISEHTARLLQIKRGLDQVSDGFYVRLPNAEERDFRAVFDAFDKMSHIVEQREQSLRSQNVQLAAAVSRIEKLLDATIDGIAYVGQDGAFKFVNRRFCEILGLRTGILNKKTVSDGKRLWQDSIVEPERLQRVLTPPAHDDEDGSLDVVDNVIELKGAEPRYAQAYGAPVLDDDGIFAGRIISLHDNTREMELDRLKTEFISVVSHELRTPLTSIKGYTDLMLSGATGEINEIQREFLGILQSSANRLGNLINDILDLSKIDGGRIEVKQEPVDYIKIVADVLRLMKAHADEKEISLDVSFPQNLPMVSGDHDKISQVVSNLLSNAIKYTPPGGWIKVLIEVEGDTAVRTCVADSGIGISPADQKKLFQKFFRADNSLTREAGGTGLGLVIVKSIIEMLGGAIWVQSDTGRGSKFFFTLPLYSDRKQAGSNNKTVSVPERGIALVLVVDNSSFVRETLQHSLHRRGYGVITASSSEEAQVKASLHKPDIILLDIMMDDCGGYKTLFSLRENPSSASLPIIAFSMHGEGSKDKIALGPISFSGRQSVFKNLIDLLTDRQTQMGRRPFVLIVNLRAQTHADDAELAEQLKSFHFDAVVVDGPELAVASIVSRQPDAIVIDAESAEDGPLFGLLKTLKSEMDFARIPVVFALGDVDFDGVHFHLGDCRPDVRPAVDYIGEQVAIVMRSISFALPSPVSDNAGPESGILTDN